jgi:hypothetical protein
MTPIVDEINAKPAEKMPLPIPVSEGIGTEIKIGPTPSGGAYMVAYFSDDTGNPVEKEQATQVEIHEFDEAGKNIQRTYGRVGR